MPSLDVKHVTRNNATPRRVLPPNEGILTYALSAQKPLVKSLVAASLQAGLAPRDALNRAVDAVEWLRAQAVTDNLDSERQGDIKTFTVAAFRADGVSRGTMLAQYAIEACRLCQEQFAKWRRDEKAKSLRGETL